VSNCRSFLERQIDIIQPQFICCLGAVAAQNLLDTNLSIGRLRGKFHDWNGIQVMATYHPAYLLRNPAMKAEVWKDMQMLMQQMGIKLPKRKPK
jgi:DNA polymerase